MSLFSEKLRNYVTDSGYTVYRLAKLSGVERTGLQRVLSGQRLLSEQALDSLLDFLQINFAEREELYHLYRIEELGESRYHQQELILLFIKKLIATRSENKITWHLEKKIQFAREAKHSYYMYHGSSQIIQIIRAAMEYLQCNSDFPVFRMFLPPDTQFLNQIIPLPEYSTHKIPAIQHLIYMVRYSEEQEINNYNLEILSTFLPFSLSTDLDYNIYYNYCENIISYDSGILFPYYIILDNILIIQLSSDLQNCMVYTIPDYIQYFTDSFDEIIEKSKRLAITYPGFGDFFHHTLETVQKNEQFYFLGYEPCFSVFLPPELAEQYINRASSDWEENLAMLENWPYSLESLEAFYCFFSLNGIRYFMETGRLTDIPAHILLPLCPEDRLVLLSRLYDFLIMYPEKIRIFDSSYFPFPDYATLFINPDYGLDYFVYKENGEASYLSFSEISLSRAFKNFIFGISNSKFLFTNEKAMELLTHYKEET